MTAYIRNLHGRQKKLITHTRALTHTNTNAHTYTHFMHIQNIWHL